MKRVVLIGMMGAGKSTLGHALSKSMNLKYIDVDAYLEKKWAMSISEMFQEYGELQFRIWEKEALKELINLDFELISTGGGAVLDQENRVLIKENSFCFYLKATVETLVKRLENDDSRPLLKSGSLEEVFKKRTHLYESLSDCTILTDDMAIETILAKMVEVLNENSFN